MITRATLSTIEQGLPKYRSMLAGNTAYSPGAYDSIASAVGSGSSTITFSAIPSSYQHLQLRFYNHFNADTYCRIRFNGDTGSNYPRHYYFTDGVTGYVIEDGAGTTAVYYLYNTSAGTTYSPVGIIDIHNYASTAQRKTIRLFGGVNEQAETNELFMASQMWNNTSAITSIEIAPLGSTFASNNYVGLYGIKGA